MADPQPPSSSGGFSLTNMPADVIYNILEHIDTAQGVARLSRTSRTMNHVIEEKGWRIWVKSRFTLFNPSAVLSNKEWAERARVLTAQSRDWDRRGVSVKILTPPPNQQIRAPLQANNQNNNQNQSIPCNILVDAYHHRLGQDAQELVFWGAGEDVFGMLRHNIPNSRPWDEWMGSRGAKIGYSSGRDDITAVSILKDVRYNYGPTDDYQVLVGRASGKLHMMSMATHNFGKQLVEFREPSLSGIQRNIQAVDFNYQLGLIAAATKEGILTYSTKPDEELIRHSSDGTREPYILPVNSVVLKANPAGCGRFDFIRQVKYINEDTLAVSLNSAHNPIQYVKYTPDSVHTSSAAKMSNDGSRELRTARALLPLNMSSFASGSGKSLLSSWDDGTVQLQDIRTRSRFDMVFQDNFDLATPISALLTRGTEQFFGGSAQSSVLKVFDYRWPKGYYHTDALACGNDTPYPVSHPPVIVKEPYFRSDRLRCKHTHGKPCRWHALSKLDYHRPNFNMWLNPKQNNLSPVYSLAMASDDSASVFAGLGGRLAEITVSHYYPHYNPRESSKLARNVKHSSQLQMVSVIDTGPGFLVTDPARSARMPIIRRQAKRAPPLHPDPDFEAWTSRHRFDTWLQGRRDS